MVEIIKAMKPYAKVPLIVKPNAGKPRLVDGKTVFNMDANTFCSYAEALVGAGANALGGCCGTTPEYIRKLSAIAGKLTAEKPVETTLPWCHPTGRPCSSAGTAADCYRNLNPTEKIPA